MRCRSLPHEAPGRRAVTTSTRRTSWTTGSSPRLTTIAAFAVENGMAIVSADSDFATLVAIGKGSAPSLVLFRSIDALTPADQGALIAASLDTVTPALEEGAVVSMRRGHIRVRPLPLT